MRFGSHWIAVATIASCVLVSCCTREEVAPSATPTVGSAPTPAPAEQPPATAPVPTAAPATVLTEEQKIEELIRTVEKLEGATFIRNAEEHSPADAASHMRRKWRSAGKRIQTAEQFIEHCATRSSMSGEVYKIRFADGKEQPSGEFFRARLAELEGQR